jgi:hypothetical protein
VFEIQPTRETSALLITLLDTTGKTGGSDKEKERNAKFSQTQKNGSQEPKLRGALKKRNNVQLAVSGCQAQGLIFTS